MGVSSSLETVHTRWLGRPSTFRRGAMKTPTSAMRRLYTVASHPLTLLTAALGLNLWNDIHGRATICGTLRPHVGPRAMSAVVAGIVAWFLPHYRRPFKGISP